MKARNTSAPGTLDAIDAERKLLLARQAELDKQAEALRQNKLTELKGAFDSFPNTLTAILGRPVNLTDALGMAKDHIANKLSVALFGQTQGTNGTHATRPRKSGKRTSDGRQYRAPMSDTERDRLKAVLIARQAVIDAGGAPTQTISEVSKEFGVTDATTNKWKAAWGLTRASRA